MRRALWILILALLVARPVSGQASICLPDGRPTCPRITISVPSGPVTSTTIFEATIDWNGLAPGGVSMSLRPDTDTPPLGMGAFGTWWGLGLSTWSAPFLVSPPGVFDNPSAWVGSTTNGATFRARHQFSVPIASGGLAQGQPLRFYVHAWATPMATMPIATETTLADFGLGRAWVPVTLDDGAMGRRSGPAGPPVTNTRKDHGGASSLPQKRHSVSRHRVPNVWLITGPALDLQVQILEASAPIRAQILVGIGPTCTAGDFTGQSLPLTFKPGDPRSKLSHDDVPQGRQACLRVQTLDGQPGTVSLDMIWRPLATRAGRE